MDMDMCFPSAFNIHSGDCGKIAEDLPKGRLSPYDTREAYKGV